MIKWDMAATRRALIDYMRAHRGTYSDDEIRAQLLEEGVTPEDIEEAFRRTEKKGKRSWRAVLLAWTAGSAVTAVLVLGFFYWMGSRSTLIFVERQLPKAVPGDAGEDFARAVELSSEGSPDALALEALERAAGKRRNRGLGPAEAPASIEEALEMNARNAKLFVLGRIYLRKGRRLEAEGRHAEAIEEFRKGLGLGYLMLQDWEPNARFYGLALSREYAEALETVFGGKSTDAARRLRKTELIRQLERKFGTPAETHGVLEAAGDPGAIKNLLLTHLSTPGKMEKFLPWILIATVINWSEEEIRIGRPARQRELLLGAVAEIPDHPSAEKLALGYLRVLETLTARLARETPETRSALLQKLKIGFFPLSDRSASEPPQAPLQAQGLDVLRL